MDGAPPHALAGAPDRLVILVTWGRLPSGNPIGRIEAHPANLIRIDQHISGPGATKPKE